MAPPGGPKIIKMASRNGSENHVFSEGHFLRFGLIFGGQNGPKMSQNRVPGKSRRENDENAKTIVLLQYNYDFRGADRSENHYFK